MIEPKLTKATIEDIPELNKISLASKRHWKYPEEWIERWKEDLKIKSEFFENGQVYKFGTLDSIFGFCVILKNENDFIIEHLWVLPEYIGKGYGKLLLTESIKRTVKKDAEITVFSDPNAEPFYSSRGFKTIDKLESFPKGRYLPIMKLDYKV